MSKYSEMVDFKGKTVVVTGGLSGAGRLIAEVFIEAGADVVLTYNRSADAEASLRAVYPDAQHAKTLQHLLTCCMSGQHRLPPQ